jgi:predicted phage-related endonuclease
MSDQAWRRDALGGSDAAALVGVDPYRELHHHEEHAA